jgi:hypothetical protein
MCSGKLFYMTFRNKAVMSLFFLLASCNDEAKTSTTQNDSDSADAPGVVFADTVPAGCYSQVMARDTASLQITNKGNAVSGSLSYNIYEKDRNDGTIQADQTGDVIRGWYLFKSEGVISVREVAWKVNGEELWPATGEVVQRNDTTLFAQPGSLNFDSAHPFKKIPCII